MVTPQAGLDYKPANKQRRRLLHIKRKRAQDVAQRNERFARRKEEARNPQLKEERLRQNIPLTLERKRVWDDAPSDVKDVLGLSVNVERIKRQKQEENAKLDQAISEEDDGDSNVPEQEADDQDDDVDSMIMTDSEDEDADEGEDGDGQGEDRKAKKSASSRKSSIPTPTERATSPSQFTQGNNLDMVPEELAAKFPSLFPDDFPTPKILITTSLNSTLHHEARLLTDLFPNSVYIRRTAHRHAHKFSLREISSFAANRNYTAVIVLEEDQKRPSGLTVVHLPHGPTFHFSMSNFIEGKKLPGHGRSTDHWPELILTNFLTPLGLLTSQLFRTLFPAQPHFEGRQVLTVLNQRGFIFIRRHRYAFREKRETEKSVVGADGKEMKGAEGIRAALQEIGPRLTLKLRRIDKGIQRSSGQEWEWKGQLEKTRTKFLL
jgi:ribosome production factor 1